MFLPDPAYVFNALKTGSLQCAVMQMHVFQGRCSLCRGGGGGEGQKSKALDTLLQLHVTDNYSG